MGKKGKGGLASNGGVGVKLPAFTPSAKPNSTYHEELEIAGNFSCFSNLNPLANKQTQTLAVTISHLLTSLKGVAAAVFEATLLVCIACLAFLASLCP